MVRNLWQHRDLIRQFTKREIEGRYKGSFLGIFWSIINPLILLLCYTFVFGVVFQSRWAQAKTDSLLEFAVTIFCGLTVFNLFSETVGRSPTLVVAVPNYVKKVVFPLEILPLSSLVVSAYFSLFSFAILIIANFFVTGSIPWTIVFVPIILLPLFGFSLGISWLLASFGVFVRDITYFIALILQLLFFLTPIFYSLESVPSSFVGIIRANPLASIVENVRRVVLWGMYPNWVDILIWTTIACVVLVVAYAWFMKTKKAFADVI